MDQVRRTQFELEKDRMPVRCLQRCAAFSLLEILVVLAIIAMLSAFAIPSLRSVMVGANLNRSGQMVSDQMVFARQEAVTKNREVQVRFYYLSTKEIKGWRGVQVWRSDQTANGLVETPVSRLVVLADGIIMNLERSPLLNADGTLVGSTRLALYGDSKYSGFRYRSNGSPASSVTEENNFVTLQHVAAKGNPPANYYTIQVNPITGKAIVFHP